MDARELLHQARDAMSVGRVFGEPIDKDGVIIIPVARIAGGAGGGGNTAPGKGDASVADAAGPGMGLGFGMLAGPAGVYVIKGGEVTWKPAFDPQRLTLIGGLVAVVAMLVIRSIVRGVVRGC